MFYIDTLKHYKHKKKQYAHLIGMCSINELHLFMQQNNISSCWFHATPYPHYDICEKHYLSILHNENIQIVTSRKIVTLSKERLKKHE